MRPDRGASYVEIILAAAILVTLAGVVVPQMQVRRVENATHSVEQDLADLARAIEAFIADTRTFPTGHDGAATYHYLFTDGMRPENNVMASGPGMHVDQFLNSEQFAPRGWNGPYLKREIGPDPWGRAYVINVNGFFSSGERVLVLSAGPNGQINTPLTATVASGDDIAVVIDGRR